MNRENFIGLQLTTDYTPLIKEIDAMAQKKGISRSAIVRELLCDAFQFTPGNPIHKYNSGSRIGSKL